MDVRTALKAGGKYVQDNSPTILTGVAVAGTVATSVFAARGALRADQVVRDWEDENHEMGSDIPLTRKVYVKLTWKCYVPAVGMGVTTITCIVMANRIGTRRAAAVASAFAIAEQGFDEYREKVVERMGEQTEREVRDEVAQEQVRRGKTEIIIVGTGKMVCYDSISGRTFESNQDLIRKAENSINATINNDQYASLSDFWELIGLSTTPYSSEVGWNLDQKLDVHFAAVMGPDETPMMSVCYRYNPIRNYTDYR